MNAKIITIFSSKGGVGKTFVSINLATSLVKAGHKVLVVDLDLQAGQDMARMLNISPGRAIVETFDMLTDSEQKVQVSDFIAQHTCGLHFIPAVKTTKQLGNISPDSVKAFLRQAKTEYDFIVVDACNSFNDTLITVFDYSNLILLVATPDILSVYQIKWSIDILQSLHFPLKMIKMVLNRSESRGGVAWQEVRSALPCEILGHIPSDGKIVGLALNRGVPCVIESPKSKVADAINRLRSALMRDDIYIPTMDVEKIRLSDDSEQPEQFWEKFGIVQHPGASVDEVHTSNDDELISLKKKIHEKLVDQLHLDGITPETLRDPNAVIRIKKTSEEVVLNILIEESGGRITSHEERVRIVNDIVNEALGLGPLEDFLADPAVTDIMVNRRDQIYVEKNGKLVLTNKAFISEDKMRAVIDRIIAPLGRRIDESTPMVDARLPDGSRINAIIPPLSLSGPMITIRKFGAERLEIQDLLTKYDSLTKNMSVFLDACVLGRKNMVISGGTGAGKTTLLNVISEFIPDNERIITIEDAAELRLKKTHWGRLESRPSNVEGRGEVKIRDLFINCLRMRPDRIVIGECRGAEVLDMLQAMNTGHDGSMTTLHANSTRDVLTRMHSMILLSGIELPVRAINEMISSAIQVIVHINRFSDGTRKITGISETVGLDENFQLQLEDVFVFKQSGIDENGKILGSYVATGYIPNCYKDFVTRGLKISEDMFKEGEC